MPQLTMGQPNDPTAPQLQLFIIDGDENPIDAAYVGFRILDISSKEKKCYYAQQSFDRIQVYPSQGPKYLDVVNLYTGDPAGHKIGTGNYYAPFTPDENLRVGEYIIVWEWQLAGAPFSMTRESFSVEGI